MECRIPRSKSFAYRCSWGGRDEEWKHSLQRQRAKGEADRKTYGTPPQWTSHKLESELRRSNGTNTSWRNNLSTNSTNSTNSTARLSSRWSHSSLDPVAVYDCQRGYLIQYLVSRHPLSFNTMESWAQFGYLMTDARARARW